MVGLRNGEYLDIMIVCFSINVFIEITLHLLSNVCITGKIFKLNMSNEVEIQFI